MLSFSSLSAKIYKSSNMEHLSWPEAAVFWQMEEVSRIQLNPKKLLALRAPMLSYKNYFLEYL